MIEQSTSSLTFYGETNQPTESQVATASPSQLVIKKTVKTDMIKPMLIVAILTAAFTFGCFSMSNHPENVHGNPAIFYLGTIVLWGFLIYFLCSFLTQFKTLYSVSWDTNELMNLVTKQSYKLDSAAQFEIASSDIRIRYWGKHQIHRSAFEIGGGSTGFSMQSGSKYKLRSATLTGYQLNLRLSTGEVVSLVTSRYRKHIDFALAEFQKRLNLPVMS